MNSSEFSSQISPFWPSDKATSRTFTASILMLFPRRKRNESCNRNPSLSSKWRIVGLTFTLPKKSWSGTHNCSGSLRDNLKRSFIYLEIESRVAVENDKGPVELSLLL